MIIDLKKYYPFIFWTYFIFLLIGTLWPFNFLSDVPYLINKLKNVEWIPFTYWCPNCGIDYKNKLLNLFIFLPYGFLLSLKSIHGKPNFQMIFRTMWYGFLLSIFIEIAQIFLPSRTTQASDLVLNTIGAMAGSGVLFPFSYLTGWHQMTNEPSSETERRRNL